jgi:hypothetical protein
MEGRQRRSFTDDYKRQAVDLAASSGPLDRIGGQRTWPARFGVAAVGRATWGQAGAVGGSRGRHRPIAAPSRRRRRRVWVDATGHVGAQDVASIESEPDRTICCCERGSHFVLAYRLYEWKRPSLSIWPRSPSLPPSSRRRRARSKGAFAEAVSIMRTMRGEAASGVISPRPAGFTPAAFFRRYRNQIGLRRFVIWG